MDAGLRPEQTDAALQEQENDLMNVLRASLLEQHRSPTVKPDSEESVWNDIKRKFGEVETLTVNYDDAEIFTLNKNHSDIGSITPEGYTDGLKWVGRIPMLTKSTVQEIRNIWSNLIMELVCKHILELESLFQISVPDLEKVGVFRPDFRLAKDLFEMKTYFEKPPAQRMMKDLNRISAQFGKSDFKIHAVLIVADENLPNRIGLKPKEHDAFMFVRRLMKRAHREFKSEFDQDEINTMEQYSDLNELIEKFPFKPWHVSGDFIAPQDVGKFKDVTKRILLNCGPIKEWLDPQTIGIESMVDTAIPDLPNQNISYTKPLDRDFNRTEFGTKYGHRGKLLNPVVCVKETPLSELITEFTQLQIPLWSSLYRLHTGNRDILEEIREVNRMIALLDSDTADSVYKFISMKYKIPQGGYHETKKYLYNRMAEKIEDRRALLPSAGTTDQSKWTLKKNGSFRLLSQEDKKKLHLGQWDKKEDTKPADEPDFALFNDKWESDLNKLYKRSQWKIEMDPDVTQAYSFNDSTKKLADEIAATSEPFFDQIAQDPTMLSIYSQMKFARELVMRVPKMTSKYSDTPSFFVIESKETSTLIFTSVNPNENTSGIISYAQLVSEKTAQRFRDDYTFGDWDIYPTNSGRYIVISKPFRTNLKYIVQLDAHIGSYYGAQALWYSRHGHLVKSPLWKSLFWQFDRQVIKALEFVYILLTRSTCSLNFGLVDCSKKFKDMNYKDSRIGQIMTNGKLGFKRFVKQYRRFGEKSVFDKTLVDPFFGEEITTKDDLWFLVYTKQCLIKDDGFDSAKLAWGFFEDDLQDEAEWAPNPFNSLNGVKNPLTFTIEDFFKNLLKPGTGEWQNASYCPEFIMATTKKAYKEYQGRYLKKFVSALLDKTALDNLRSSKVNTSTAFEFCSYLEGSYSGLASVMLAEGILWDVHMMRNEKEEFELYIGGVKVQTYQEPNIGTLALYDMFRHPQKVLLVPHNKIQTGYGKRQFYEMTIYGRNINVAIDNGFRPLLAIFPQDMILKSGDEKLLDLEEIIEKLVTRFQLSKLFISSEDQKRFGDSYPLEAFDCLCEALKRIGLLTDKEREMASHAFAGMWGRLHIVPSTTQRIIREKDRRDKKLFEYVNNILQEKFGFFNEILTKYNKPIGKLYNHTDFKEFSKAYSENLGMHKHVGFALGVFNVLATFLSCLNTYTVEKMMNNLIGDTGVESKSHSDDGLKFTILPPINKKIFRNANIKEIIQFATTHTNFRIDIDNGKWIGSKISDNNNEDKSEDGSREDRELTDLTVLFVVLTLLMPRFIGQRPSLWKWFFGVTGEVLQVCYDEEGSHVPLIRYCSPILKDLPGKSFATDLIGACSRVLPVLQFGGDATLSHILLVGINFLVRHRFGLNNIQIRWDILPQMFGGWYALPHEMLEWGFEANNIRLFAMATKNRTLDRSLAIMLMTRDLWVVGGGADPQKVAELGKEIAKNDLEAENSNLGKVTLEDTFERVGDNWVDPKIRFARQLKTLRSFSAQMDAFSSDIESAKATIHKDLAIPIDELREDDDEEIRRSHSKFAEEKLRAKTIKGLFRDFTLAYLYKLPSYNASLINHLNKYTTSSFQEGYIRVPMAAKLINRLGYPERLMGNPFAGVLKDLNKEDIMTIAEMINTVMKYAASDEPIPIENQTMLSFYKTLYNKAWNTCLNRHPTYVWKSIGNEERLKGIAQLRFRKVYRELSDMVLNYRPKELVGYLIERVGMEREPTKTVLYANKPSLIFDPNFNTICDVIFQFFKDYKGKAAALAKNSRLLVHILSSVVHPVVLKTSSEKIAQVFYEDRGMLNFKMTQSHFITGVLTHIKMPFRTNKESLSTALVLLAIDTLATGRDYTGCSLIYRSTPTIIEPIALLDNLASYSRIYNVFDVNTILCAIICTKNAHDFLRPVDLNKLLEFLTISKPKWAELLNSAYDIKALSLNYNRLVAIVIQVQFGKDVLKTERKEGWLMLASTLDEFQTLTLFTLGFYAIQGKMKGSMTLEKMGKLMFSDEDGFVGEFGILKSQTKGLMLVKGRGTAAIISCPILTILKLGEKNPDTGRTLIPWSGTWFDTVDKEFRDMPMKYLLTPWRIYKTDMLFSVTKDGKRLHKRNEKFPFANELLEVIKSTLEVLDIDELMLFCGKIIIEAANPNRRGVILGKFKWFTDFLYKPEYYSEKVILGRTKTLTGELNITFSQTLLDTESDFSKVIAGLLRMRRNDEDRFFIMLYFFYLELSNLMCLNVFTCFKQLSLTEVFMVSGQEITLQYWEYISNSTNQNILVKRAAESARRWDLWESQVYMLIDCAILRFSIISEKGVKYLKNCILNNEMIEANERTRLSVDFTTPLNLSVDFMYAIFTYIFHYEDMATLLITLNEELSHKLFWNSRTTWIFHNYLISKLPDNLKVLFHEH